jgi:predicted transcriptional regulator
MAESTTLTVRLPAQTKEQLAELANLTRRTSSFLAAEAIAGYVARELAIVAAIERGREDARMGRVVPHDAVMREARAVIEDARTKP